MYQVAVGLLLLISDECPTLVVEFVEARPGGGYKVKA